MSFRPEWDMLIAVLLKILKQLNWQGGYGRIVSYYDIVVKQYHDVWMRTSLLFGASNIPPIPYSLWAGPPIPYTLSALSDLSGLCGPIGPIGPISALGVAHDMFSKKHEVRA